MARHQRGGGGPDQRGGEATPKGIAWPGTSKAEVVLKQGGGANPRSRAEELLKADELHLAKAVKEKKKKKLMAKNKFTNIFRKT